MKRTFQGLLALWGLFSLYLCASLVGGAIPGKVAPMDGGGDVRIGLYAGPIHTDFVLPATAETREAFGFAASHGVPVEDQRTEWLVVGWGGRSYYTQTGTWRDIRLGPTLRGVFGDASVLRVDVAGPIPDSAPVDWITLSAPGYTALIAAIVADTNGTPHPSAGFTSTDRFFLSDRRFNAFRTCNTWISTMLRAAGQPFGVWTPTLWSIDISLKRFTLHLS